MLGNYCSVRNSPRSHLTASVALLAFCGLEQTSVVFKKQDCQTLPLTALQHTKTKQH